MKGLINLMMLSVLLFLQSMRKNKMEALIKVTADSSQKAVTATSVL
ncbi:MAG: hypothetical protein RL007_1183 [Bacteroidota bacterium]|jgi:hypothetical protein